MTIWTDKHGRNIQITVSVDSAYAAHQGERVGCVDTTGERDVDDRTWYPPKITGMFVDEAYKRSGIGLRLIEALFDEYGMLEPADKNVGIGNMNALTNEGLSLTRKAQKAGFVCEFADEIAEDGLQREDDDSSQG